ncbi:SMI1/KNR4 family protein [Deinococcus hohokamensis]|uniref:SMI1/KNR4 family protein n=1 Tax=Deinococcus hohokamensis TaxID=309883 RepID=A0ABV9IE13_9DEIO
MSVTESLQAINAWLLAHGVVEDERPAPASPDVLEQLSSTASGDAVAELMEFYGHQNGFPHWFILYGTWQFLTLEESLEQMDALVRSSAHLGAPEQWKPEWLPVLTNNGGDYCFQDLNHGGLDFYSHIDGERLPVNRSLEEFLERLVRDIRRNDYVFEDDEPTYRGTEAVGYG